MTRPPLPAERRRRSIAEKDRAAFLEYLAAGYSVRHAARESGRAFRRFYEQRQADEAFAAAWAEAIEQGTQSLEDEARRRAVDGVDEPVFQKGEQVGSIRRYSDALLMFLLKGRRPAIYREGGDGNTAPVRIVLESAFGPAVRAEVIDGQGRELEAS